MTIAVAALRRSRRLAEIATEHPVAAVFVFALAVRVVTAAGIALVTGGSLFPDDVTYSDMAAAAAAEQDEAWDPYTAWLYRATATLLIPVTALYEVFGPVRFAGQVFVALAGAGAAAAVTAIATLVAGRTWALAAGGVVAFLPSQIVWSSLIMKDALVWLAVAATGFFVARLARATDRTWTRWVVAIAASLFLLAFLRLHTLVVVSWALVATCWIGRKETRLARVASCAAIAIGLPWIVGIGPAGVELVLNSGSLAQRRALNAVGARTAVVAPSETEPAAAAPLTATEFERLRQHLDLEEGSPEQVSEELADLERRGDLDELSAEIGVERDKLAAIAEEGVVADANEPDPPRRAVAEEGLRADVEHLPRGLAVMLVEPVPWGGDGSLALRLARLEMLVWYPLLALAAIGVVRGIRYLDVMAFPVVCGFGILITYALTEGNIGTAYRHRGEFVWTIALLATLGARVALPMITARARRAT